MGGTNPIPDNETAKDIAEDIAQVIVRADVLIDAELDKQRRAEDLAKVKQMALEVRAFHDAKVRKEV